MGKVCAYCDFSGKLTKEHLFPASVIARYNELWSSTDKLNKFFQSDLKIKDVCSACNNGFLSDLDNRFLPLFDQYMLNPINSGESADFEYDYHKLLRFLLKVSYNSSRVSVGGQETRKILARYVPYIMGSESNAENVLLYLQIYTSAYYTSANMCDTNSGQITRLLETKFLRSTKIVYDGIYNSDFVVRAVVFNSYWFFLVIPVKTVSKLKLRSFRKQFENWKTPTGIFLSKNVKKLHVPREQTSSISWSLLEGMFNLG